MNININRIALAVILLFTLSFGQIAAQESKAITVGDNLPDFVIPKIVRWNKKTASTAQFKDKLLIIDFWATHCGSCVEALPHMQELQDKYGSMLMILPVTDQEEPMISQFLKTNRYLKNVTLPSVVEDKRFRALFPYAGIPHEVWVYKGKVIGVTLGSYVNTSNIDAILEGRIPNLPFKYDFYKFDPAEPLFKVDTNLVNKKTIIYSAISGFRKGVNSDGVDVYGGIIRNKEDKTIRFSYINGWISGIYKTLFMQINQSENKGFVPIYAAKVLWEVADRVKYRYLPELGITYDWAMAHDICFESVQPDKGQCDADVYRSVIQDMNRLLGLNVRWEKRRETVYVLKDKPGETFKGGSINPELARSIGFIAEQWNTHEDNAFMFEESTVPDSIKNNYSSVKDKIDITDAEWKDFDALQKKLNKHGLDVVKEEREIDKLVFSEVGFKKSVSK